MGGRHARDPLPAAVRVLGCGSDMLPPGLQGRVGVTAQHVTVVALVLAAAMAMASWIVIRSSPEPVPAPRRASLQLPSPARPGQPSPAQAPRTQVTAAALVVHVTGKVRRAGIVELPSGARVVDAIEAAGGARPGVDLATLNLARPVVDGEQIAVGVRAVASAVVPGAAPVPGVTPTAGAPAALVNLNTATQAQLEELPGVGPVTATSIIEWRTENGGFSTVDELLEVSGIGEVTLGELRELVTV